MKNLFHIALLCMCTIGCSVDEEYESINHALSNRSVSEKLKITLYQSGDSTEIAAEKFIAGKLNGACIVQTISGTDTLHFTDFDRIHATSKSQSLRVNVNGINYEDKTSVSVDCSANELDAVIYPGNQNISSVLIVGDESGGF